MRLSLEADYAVRCVLYLTAHQGEMSLIDSIASEMEIPRSFAAKILQKLTRTTIIRGRRGVGGGFQLVREPAQITLLDVVQAIEGPVVLNRCVLQGYHCNRKAHCTVHPIWNELTQTIVDRLRTVTFADLAARG